MKINFTFKSFLCIALFAGTGSTQAQETTFDFTGAVQTYTVPLGVTSIQIEAWGAQGQNSGSSTGGNGGYVSGEIDVTPGDILYVYVGGQNGFNGGGLDGGGGGYTAGRGGGASDVRIGGMTFSDRVIVAGGGGGAGRGTCSSQDGGDGGWPGGTGGWGDGVQGGSGTLIGGGSCSGSGGCALCCSSSLGGGGGGQDGGGAQGGYGTAVGGTGGACGGDNSSYSGGCSNEAGGGGCFGTGGNGINPSCNGGGGGGGGGYYGGGSGGANWGSGGGGGSSYFSLDLESTLFENGIRTGNGQVIIEVLCSGITVTVSDDVICLGDSFTLEGSGLGTISWDGGVENGVPFTPAAAGVFTYTSSSDDGGDCGFSLDIEVLALPTVVASVDETEVCLGESVIFTGSGADTYSWDMGVTDGAAFEPGVGTEVYTVTGTDAITGCENTDEIEVVVNDLPTVVANATDNEICLGESFTLTGSGATAYVWTPDGTLDGEEITPDATGTTTYEVTGTDDNGCVNTASIEVTVYEAVTITYTTEDEMMGADGSIDIAVTGGNPAYSFDWDNDGTGDFDDTEDLTGLAGGTYIVVVQDEAGCSINESILVSSQLGVSTNALPTLAIYPNPVRDNLTITQEGNFVYQLVTLEGKVLVNGSGLNQKVIDMNEFAKGVYLLNVTANGQEVSVKVVVE